MKKFLIWITTIVLTLIILDTSLGYLFKQYMSKHGLPGDYESIDYILRHNNNDVLVLGSSVGLNSLNTKQIEDSIGLPTFNGSANGQTFPFYLTILKATINQEHKPMMVILCLTTSNLSDTGLGTRYNFLAPYYGESIGDIDQRLDQQGAWEHVFLKSNTYRLNTIWFRIFLYNFFSAGIKGENGSIAKPIPQFYPVRQHHIESEISDERKLELNEFIQICNDNRINLMILLTPQYIDTSCISTDPIINYLENISINSGIPFYNDIALQPFSADSTLFYDNTHININGTELYTPIVINRILQITDLHEAD